MAWPLGRISPRKLAAALAALAVMALALASAAAPAQAFASELAASDAMAGSGAVEYEYYDADGTWKTGTLGSDDYEVVTQDNCDLYDVGWYVVFGDVVVNNRIDVGENARLVLCGGAELDVQRGIRVPAGSSLSVFAGRPAGSSGGIAGGTLLATGSGGDAGIGCGSMDDDAGSVTVHGGTVYALGSVGAAGIGGGDHAAFNGGNGGPVTVYGGTVYAQGGDIAAGIGGGMAGSGGTVAVYGGAVTGIAGGGFGAAGIGRGSYGGSDGALTLGPGVSIYGKDNLEDSWGPCGGGRASAMSTDSTTVCKVTATFHARGICGDPQAQEVRRLGRFSEPDPEPSAQGYTFAGWYADEGCTSKFGFEKLAAADVDVWAKWEKKQEIQVPAAAAGLVYNGKVQTGVAAGAGYTVEGGSATDAGDYAATLIADADHVFEGGAATVSVPWSIARKPISAPSAATGLVYSGQAQTGVAAGAGYTVKGGSATNAGDYTATLTAKPNYQFPGGKATATVKWSIAKAAISVPKAKAGLVYSGRAQTGVAAGAGYTIVGNAATGAGSYTATLTADKNHAFPGGKSTATVKWSIAKAANPLKIANATRNAKATTANKTVLGAKIKKKGQGKVTYTKVKVNKKKYKDNFTVSKKTGKITVRKGTPKGTYKVTVQAVAKGNANYKKSAAKKAVVTIKVK